MFVALGGTALAATSTIVNIADPTTPSHVARVDATGKLEAVIREVKIDAVGNTNTPRPA